MSDHWEYFPCQMGENLAFVSYDHGIRETIDSLQQNQQVRFDLAYKSPTENGLPTNEEFDVVSDIEDRIGGFATSMGGVYVGRVTTAGHRYFYCFVEASSEQIEGFVQDIAAKFGYTIDSRVLVDAKKDGYWKDLYPTDDDWQMIQDSKVVDTLRKHGDDPDIVRRIDHWIYFRSKTKAKAYISWLHDHQFSLQGLTRTKLLFGRWQVQCYRDDSPELFGINRITYQLRHKAVELDGDYDGWETSVEKGSG